MALNSTGQTLKPSDLADKLISAFQTRNFENYKILVLDTTDYKEFLNGFLTNNRVSGIERAHLNVKHVTKYWQDRKTKPYYL